MAGAGCLLALAAGRLSAQAPDSTFLLSTRDVRRSPSAFLGNGRVGVVIPPLGLGASRSLVAGLYEHGPDDVPRIVAAPAWNAIDVFDGTRWLATEPPTDSSIRGYHQTVDMRTGTARTTYDWVDGVRRTSVLIETLVSRAAPRLAAVRLELVPRQPGPMRVRFALAGWPPPRRLALARLERAEPGRLPRPEPGRVDGRLRGACSAAASSSSPAVCCCCGCGGGGGGEEEERGEGGAGPPGGGGGWSLHCVGVCVCVVGVGRG